MFAKSGLVLLLFAAVSSAKIPQGGPVLKDSHGTSNGKSEKSLLEDSPAPVQIDESCTDGATWDVECNTCSCDDGKIHCTRMLCIPENSKGDFGVEDLDLFEYDEDQSYKDSVDAWRSASPVVGSDVRLWDILFDSRPFVQSRIRGYAYTRPDLIRGSAQISGLKVQGLGHMGNRVRGMVHIKPYQEINKERVDKAGFVPYDK